MKRQFDKKKIFVGILAILIFSFLFIKSIYNYNQYFTVNKDIVGMRDKIIHQYFDIDLDIVWDVLKQDLPKLKEQIQNILKKDDLNYSR